MGTETYSLHLRYQVKPLYIVKLNNPQMGTETLNTLNLLEYCVGYVKLNNPLMGTETYENRCTNVKFFFHVKLNDPLMGTETHDYTYHHLIYDLSHG